MYVNCVKRISKSEVVMEDLFYQMIFKRKSFHIFRETQNISVSELKDIEEKYKTFKSLSDNIKTDIKIVPAKDTTCKRAI